MLSQFCGEVDNTLPTEYDEISPPVKSTVILPVVIFTTSNKGFIIGIIDCIPIFV